MRQIAHCLLLTLLLTLSAQASSLKLPGLFADGMMLQRDMPIRVWGWAAGGSSVTVVMGQSQAAATADAQGRWQVELPALTAGGPHTLTIRCGDEQRSLKDVLIGDLWICSGQSNMEMMLRGCAAPPTPISTDQPNIRLFILAKQTSDRPMDNCAGEWHACSAQVAAHFSGAAFYFGEHLHRELGVPIGLIQNAWGGTVAQAWSDEQTLAQSPELQPLLAQRDQMIRRYVESALKLAPRWQQWAAEAQAAVDGNRLPPLPPIDPLQNDPRTIPNVPTWLYNGLTHPLTPLRIRGVIWYQGESNAGQPAQYRTLFPAMIQGWRRAWGQGDFPFVFVQLANYMARQLEPAQSSWAELREAQTVALKLPNTGMAVTIDIGDGGDIHPRNKYDVGKRLALAALKVAYGRELVYSGPMYRSISVEGDAIRVYFDHVGGGLVLREAEVGSFAIAGEDQKFVWADAKVDGDSIVVRSGQVPNPVAVRYAWGNNPVANLYNAEGLPASPFRSDSWQR